MTPRTDSLQKESKPVPQIPIEIVHDAVTGRIRFRHLGLIDREDLASRVASALTRYPGIETVRASTVTGSVLVKFGPPARRERIADVIELVIAGRDLLLQSRPQARSLSAASAVVTLPSVIVSLG